MEETPTIWVVNDAGHPTWLALNIVPEGELRALSGREANPLFIDRLTYDFAQGIGKFGKSSDYLLISGSPMLNAIAVSLWLMRFGEARILQWNAKLRMYEKSTISEENMRRLLERFMVGTV